MAEKNIVETTKIPNTVLSIHQELKNLGINEGDTILVHSSLSSIGWVCGGAQAVIMALLQTVGKSGTIVMPAQSGDISDPAEWEHPPVPKEWFEEIYEHMPAFHKEMTPTRGMGVIAELFRTLPHTIRSNHPQSSFTAHGKLAEEIIVDHVLTPHFGMRSPLGKLYKLPAKVLLLGAGFDSCTSFHLAEARHKKMPKKKFGTAMYENGKRVWKWYEDCDYDSDDFDKIGIAFDAAGYATLGKVGNAECKLFDLKLGVDFAYEWLDKNRFDDNNEK